MIQQIGLFPHLTIGENIAVVPKLLGWDKKRIAARVEELLELTSLGADLRDRYPAQLSGGQRQRVGRRARARGRPAADADGRAVRRDRPDQPRAPAEPVPAPPVGDPQDDPVRHPRHRRGDQDGRPGGGAAKGRHARPVRDARGAADEPGGRLRRGLRRRRPRAEAALAAARARHRPLEGAARARRASRPARPAPRSPRRTCPTRWWSTPRGARWAGCRSATSQRETVPEQPDTSPEPILELEDVLRDALSDLLRSDTQYGPVVDGRGARGRRAVGRDHLRVPQLAAGDDAPDAGRRARRG